MPILNLFMNILAIGSHPDDVCGGCFGTLCKLKRDGNNLFYLILTLGEDGGNRWERKREQEEVAQLLNVNVTFAGLPSAHLNNDSGRATIQAIEQAILKCKPRVIFSHSINDRHQDHRLVNRATISACRFYQGSIYFYEGFSSLNTFNPTYYSRIDNFFEEKLRALSLFKTQQEKFYIKPEVVSALATYRAAQSGYIGKAEAFEVGKIIVE